MAKHYSLHFDFEPFSAGDELFIVRSLSGFERDAFLKDMRSKVDVGSDGVTTKIKDLTGLNALLLSYAVKRVTGLVSGDLLPKDIEQFEVMIKDDHLTTTDLVTESVKMSEIQSWPALMQQDLNETANQLSGLDKDARTTGKKD